MSDVLKTSYELDRRYAKACKLCHEKHKAIYGIYPATCAFREFDNEYCPDIVNAEKQRREGLSEHLRRYLDLLENSHRSDSAFSFIISHAPEFSRAELIAIIRAFDYVIHPYLTNQRNVRGFNIEVAAEAYKMVSEGVINSLNGGHPSPEIVEKPLRETIEEMERNKTPV